MEELFKGLNPPQREAVAHCDGPLLILAGPGSGKTRVVTHRIAHLIAGGVPPRAILALTFTNKAAEEMRKRVERLSPAGTPWMGTFHRFGAQLLRRYGPLVGLQENYSILDVEDSRTVLKQALVDCDQELQYVTPQQVANAISDAKSRVVSPEEYQPRAGHPASAIAGEVYSRYQTLLRQYNAVDFDDLLLLPALLLRDHPELRAELDRRHAYIMVDEYQDTNLAQYAIVRALSNELPNLAVTGDPDQSIYGWRGATISNILKFEGDYDHVAVVKLQQNYRSTPAILEAADTLISHNKHRKPKRLLTDNADGPPVRMVCYGDHQDEASGIAARIAADVEDGRVKPGEVAIFYRVNSLSRSLEHALRSQGVPYQIVHGVEFYQRKEVKDLIAYLKLLNNPENEPALLRVVNMPPRGIGKRTLERLRRHAADRRISLLDACREAGAIKSLKSRAAVAVAKFVHLIDSLSMLVHRPVEEILGQLIVDSGYRVHLESSRHEEDQERQANVDELLTAAREFDEQHADSSLDAFLEQASLVNDTDQWQSGGGSVTLMTLHASKGLEFEHAYIIAVEQGLLPHQRSRESELELEEERRLLFVGITRARRELQLSYTLRRASRGSISVVIPSPFLVELPTESMDVQRPPGSYDYPADEHAHEPPPEPDAIDIHADAVEQDPPAATSPAASPAVPQRGLRPTAIQSAAEMLDPEPQPRPTVSPESFRHGMLVRHPEYGIGTIVALSGKGKKRQASIRFLGPEPDAKFVLAFAPLQPVAGQARPAPKTAARGEGERQEP